MRRKVKNRIRPKADEVYNSENIGALINYVMKDGKKNTARTIVYDALAYIKEKAKVENPVEVFEQAMKNISPLMEVRSRRVGGANYQVPVEVRPERRRSLALRWIVETSGSKKGAPMATKLGDEIIAASKNEGEAVKKRENVHKMAEANKAFAHFSW